MSDDDEPITITRETAEDLWRLATDPAQPVTQGSAELQKWLVPQLSYALGTGAGAKERIRALETEVRVVTALLHSAWEERDALREQVERVQAVERVKDAALLDAIGERDVALAAAERQRRHVVTQEETVQLLKARAESAEDENARLRAVLAETPENVERLATQLSDRMDDPPSEAWARELLAALRDKAGMP